MIFPQTELRLCCPTLVKGADPKRTPYKTICAWTTPGSVPARLRKKLMIHSPAVKKLKNENLESIAGVFQIHFQGEIAS